MIELQPFTETDARAYLTGKRGMATGPRVEAIVERGGRNPFKLALLADLAIEDNLDVSAIRELPAADIAYLIDRVIRRIPDEDVALRWTLRYGVVPRLLTRGFLDSVLAPYVGAVLSGHLSDVDDDPSKDLLGTEWQKLDLFHPLPKGETPPPMDEVWRGLLTYAAEASWVSTCIDAPDALVIHPDARLPLRYLLRQQDVQGNKILSVLHHKAWEYFDRLGHKEAERPDLWLPEALYHKYNSDEEGAPAYCRSLLDEWASSVSVTAALAEELLRPAERGSDDGVPHSAYGADVRCLAAILLAEQALANGNVSRAELLHRTAELHAAAIKTTYGKKTLAPRLAALAAEVALARGKNQDAIDVAYMALVRGGGDEEERLRLKAVLARARLAEGGSDALEEALQVWKLAVRVCYPLLGKLAAQIVAQLRTTERYTEVAKVLAASYPLVLQRNLDDGAAMTIELLSTLQTLGLDKAAVDAGERALNVVQSCEATQHVSDVDTFWPDCLGAAIALAEWRPGRAAFPRWLALSNARSRLSPVRSTALATLEQEFLTQPWEIDELAASNDLSRAVKRRRRYAACG